MPEWRGKNAVGLAVAAVGGGEIRLVGVF